jgi:hypothetical protein
MLRSELTDWMLRADTPSIPYWHLVAGIGISPGDEKIRGARRKIMRSGPVPAILARQTPAGNWRGERSYYTPKYVSTHWSMMLLTELGVDGRDPRFRRGVEYMLATTAEELRRQMDSGSAESACFWGNLLRYALHAGYLDDPRVQHLIRNAASSLEKDPCRCRHNQHRPCAWGLVRTLWGLAAVPENRRTRSAKEAIGRGIAFLLDSHRLEKADYPFPEGGKINSIWFDLNFPLFYQVDILFTLRVLEELGALNRKGAQPALDWLEGQRGKNGRWSGASPYRQRTWKVLGGRAETDRWTTLFALRVLKTAGRPVQE